MGERHHDIGEGGDCDDRGRRQRTEQGEIMRVPMRSRARAGESLSFAKVLERSRHWLTPAYGYKTANALVEGSFNLREIRVNISFPSLSN
jgi:hypothetical protein